MKTQLHAVNACVKLNARRNAALIRTCHQYVDLYDSASVKQKNTSKSILEYQQRQQRQNIIIILKKVASHSLQLSVSCQLFYSCSLFCVKVIFFSNFTALWVL